MVQPSEPPSEHPIGHRHLNREEGQRLLFGAAQDVARLQGLLGDDNTPVFEKSRLSKNSYALVDENGLVLARIPVEAARKRLRQRVRIAKRLLSAPVAKLPAYAKQGPVGFTVNQLRMLDQEQRALAWAIGSAEPFPDPGSRLEHALTTVVLFGLCVLPGLWFLGYRAKQRQVFKEQLKELVARWRSKGRPDPPDSFFTLYNG